MVLANIVIGSLAQQLYFNLETNSRKVLVSKEESLVVYLYQHSRGALPLRLRTTRPALAGMLGINLRTLYRYTDKLVAAGALSLERGKLCITQENHIQARKTLPANHEKNGKIKKARVHIFSAMQKCSTAAYFRRWSVLFFQIPTRAAPSYPSPYLMKLLQAQKVQQARQRLLAGLAWNVLNL